MSVSDLTTSVEYRAIPGRPGYRASGDGNIQSCWTRNRPSRLGVEWHNLKLIANSRGYWVVCLRGGKTYPVHRLVLEAFVGPRPDGMECRHKDGVKTNNCPNNLEWGTHQENEDDKIEHKSRPRGSVHWGSKITEADVINIRNEFAAGGTTKIGIARRYGLHHSTVIDIISGKIWSHVV